MINRNALVYLLGLAILLALAQLFLNDYYLRIIAIMGINIILTVSLNLTNGFTGDFSLGHAAFMAIGAYSAALLTLPAATSSAAFFQLVTCMKSVSLEEQPASNGGRPRSLPPT